MRPAPASAHEFPHASPHDLRRTAAGATPRRRFDHWRARTSAWATTAVVLCLAVLGGCASPEPTVVVVEAPPMRPAEARALIAGLLPAGTTDRGGWSTDIYAAFASMKIAPTPANVCAVVAVTEQESGFRADPSVPNLGQLAWREIDSRAERAGVPAFVVRAALALASPNGKSYSKRLDEARTERELSDIFDDLIGTLPMGKRLFADWNPVRTGGPMQVSVQFAEGHAAARPYPYPVESIRREVFTRRGGMYFGIAHLLDYPAPYTALLHRFADFNAGHYASRNAALQNAISLASGIPLALDGDLVRNDADRGAAPGTTELAARVLAERLKLSHDAIRRDLEQGADPALDRSVLYRRVFALAEQIERRPLPRAVVPRIELKSPKITRKLTTEWFAQRVDERHRRCLARAGQMPERALPERAAAAD